MFPRYIESGVFDVRETPTSTMSAAASPPPIPSSNLTANSIAAIRLKYARVQRVPRRPEPSAPPARRSWRSRRAPGRGCRSSAASPCGRSRAARRAARARRSCRRRPPGRPFARSTTNRRSSTVSTRGCRTSSNGWSGNWASSAATSRVAVSPVASETMCSSTGSLGISSCVQVDGGHFAYAHSGRGRRARRAGGARAGSAGSKATRSSRPPTARRRCLRSPGAASTRSCSTC